MAVLVVVRHGETTWNATKKLQGQSDTELNDVGKKQAVAVAQALAKQSSRIAAIYSSDLVRASDTARVIADAIGCSQIVLKPLLRERHLGSLQGLTAAEARRSEPEAFKALVSSKDTAIPEGGESVRQLAERAKVAAEEIAQQHQGEKVIIVTHGGVLQAMHAHATGHNSSAGASNASISVFEISRDNRWSLQSWCDVSHLKDVGFLSSNFGGGPKLV